MSPEQSQELMDFWFGQGSLDDPEYVGQKMKMWFSKDEELDRQMRARFSGWLDTQEGDDRLAEILLLDQVPRNSFRDTAQMFAYDDFARGLTQIAIARGLHRSLHPIKAAFLLLPLEHSENLDDQNLCVRLMDQTHSRAPKSIQPITASTFSYAQKHRDVIYRFGRFPHRNQLLGRTSTKAELDFLNQPGSRF